MLNKNFLNLNRGKFPRALRGWRARKQVILNLTGELVGYHILWSPSSSQPMRILNLTGVHIFSIYAFLGWTKSFLLMLYFFMWTTLCLLKHPLELEAFCSLKPS